MSIPLKFVCPSYPFSNPYFKTSVNSKMLLVRVVLSSQPMSLILFEIFEERASGVVRISTTCVGAGAGNLPSLPQNRSC